MKLQLENYYYINRDNIKKFLIKINKDINNY